MHRDTLASPHTCKHCQARCPPKDLPSVDSWLVLRRESQNRTEQMLAAGQGGRRNTEGHAQPGKGGEKCFRNCGSSHEMAPEFGLYVSFLPESSEGFTTIIGEGLSLLAVWAGGLH